MPGVRSARRRRLGVNNRAAGSTSFDPSTISGLVGWWKADALALSDGTAVASWTDSSTASHSLVQATGSKQPLYKTAITNGLPVVRFDGVDDTLNVAFTLPQPTNVFLVARIRTTSASKYLFDGGSLNTTVLYQSPAAGNLRMYAGANTPSATGIDWSVFHLVNCEFNPAVNSDAMRVDEATSFTLQGGGNTAPGGMTLGGGGDGITGISTIDVGEALVYNNILSTANRDAVEGYLKTKWGTP